MIRTAIVAAAVALITSATAVLAFQGDELPPVQIGVDFDTAGNSGTALGPVDPCVSVNEGDTFDVDVTVRGVPPVASNFNFGLAGFGLNLNFDPSVIHVVGVNSKMMIQSSSTFEYIAGNYVFGGDANPFPGTSGDTRYDLVDLGPQNSSGDGVFARFTLQAVGPGATELKLDSQLESVPYPAMFGRIGADLLIYPVSSLQNGRITVGEPCTGAPAAYEPTLAPTLTPGPTQASATPTQADNTPSDDGSDSTSLIVIIAGVAAVCVLLGATFIIVRRSRKQ